MESKTAETDDDDSEQDGEMKAAETLAALEHELSEMAISLQQIDRPGFDPDTVEAEDVVWIAEEADKDNPDLGGRPEGLAEAFNTILSTYRDMTESYLLTKSGFMVRNGDDVMPPEGICENRDEAIAVIGTVQPRISPEASKYTVVTWYTADGDVAIEVASGMLHKYERGDNPIDATLIEDYPTDGSSPATPSLTTLGEYIDKAATMHETTKLSYTEALVGLFLIDGDLDTKAIAGRIGKTDNTVTTTTHRLGNKFDHCIDELDKIHTTLTFLRQISGI